MGLPHPLNYLWPLPWTLFGGAIGCLAFLKGGGVQVVDGVAEFYGGALGPALKGVGASAMTLGHVVLAQNKAIAEATRAHEAIHVAQYERWGPFFIPAYFASSLYQLLRGRRPYWDNAFEVEAYQKEKGEDVTPGGPRVV